MCILIVFLVIFIDYSSTFNAAMAMRPSKVFGNIPHFIKNYLPRVQIQYKYCFIIVPAKIYLNIKELHTTKL